MRDAIPLMGEFKGLLKAFPSLATIVREHLTTVAQVAVLRPARGEAVAAAAAAVSGTAPEESRVR